jgi:hypothetical protein
MLDRSVKGPKGSPAATALLFVLCAEGPWGCSRPTPGSAGVPTDSPTIAPPAASSAAPAPSAAEKPVVTWCFEREPSETACPSREALDARLSREHRIPRGEGALEGSRCCYPVAWRSTLKRQCFEPLPSDGEACPDAAVMDSRLRRGFSIESSGERVGAKCCYFGSHRLGCPCGCDRSETMTAELRERGGDAARDAILATLRTIAEREDAGYITEAMLEHRLRLLDLRPEIDPAWSVATLGPRDRGVPPAEPRRHSELRMAQDGALRVTAELIAHGETTELVNGREKLLRASFVLRLELKNLGSERVRLGPPAILARVPFPVSRWYVVGGDGRPWDGILDGGATASVNAVGYLGEPVRPGTELEATVHVHSLVLRARARARGRWDE